VFLVLLLAVSLPAAAQNAQPSAEETVLAPRVLDEVTVPYPTDANGAAQVVLELLIDPEGNVSRVVVLEGEGPFATAAERAAITWRFEPARRGGKTVAARIRFAVTFRDPSASSDAKRGGTDVPVPSGAQLAPAVPPSAPGSPPVSITVVGERAAPTGTLSAGEVRQLPGAFGDPFRAIEVLPGVTPIASGVPYFYVRGAPPGNVGYFFDGVQVPVLFHAGVGPAVLAPWFVDDVKLLPGGYPAQYGRYAGGIVTAGAAEPKNTWRGAANVRVFDTSAMVEAPFAEGRGNVMLGGRYSYSSAVFSLLSPGFDLGYWDYQGRARYDLTPDDRVSVVAFGAYDFASQEANGVKNTLYDVTFHRLDARYDRRLSSTSHVRLAATFGSDRLALTTESSGTGDDQLLILHSKTIGARAEYNHRLGKVATLRAGADVAFTQNDPENFANTNHTGELSPVAPEDVTNFGARADLVLDLDDVVSVVPGARFDVYQSEGTTVPAIEPRVSARFRVSDAVSLFHDFGLAHQMPSYVVPVPGFQPPLGNGLQRALQMSSGVKTRWPGSITTTVTVFQNGLFNSTDRLSLAGFGTRRSLGMPVVDLDARTLGRTVGVELLIKRDLTRRLGGFIAYTLARSVRSIGLAEGPSATDRTHVLNFALGYDLGRNWRAGLRAMFYTGVPAKTAYIAAAASPPRGPPFFRFDWRLEKRWPFSNERYISLVFEFLNATLSTEVTQLSCSAFYCRESRAGPVAAPSVGVEAAF
jgi:TonB family protein